MRIANFRDDVLWSIVRLMGQDPEKNLDDDQAAALVSFINAWVRRTYDAKDYPEWTFTKPFTPTTHIVPYDSIPYGESGEDARITIGRVFKAYLRDPKTTPFRPLDTPFTRRPEGIHVGFEHGDRIWLKFIEQPPQFTSKVWDSQHTYPRGELTYSPVTGQCYQSLGHTNRGQDPSRVAHILMPTELMQEHLPPTQAQPARNKIAKIGFTGTDPGPDPPSVIEAGSIWKVAVTDTSGTELAAVSYTASGGEVIAVIAATIMSDLLVALPSFVSVTLDDSDLDHPVIYLEDDADFRVVGAWQMPSPVIGHYTTSSELPISQTQSFVAAVDAAPRSRQIINVTLPDDMVKGDSVYSLTFRSPDGLEHYVEYLGLHTDGAANILTGLADQITTSPDLWMATVQPGIDVANSVLMLSVQDEFSVEAVLAPGQVIYWRLVQFPFELIDQVVRGAYSHALKEEGQSDKGAMEEKVVPTEQTISINSNVLAGADQMTDQVGGSP